MSNDELTFEKIKKQWELDHSASDLVSPNVIPTIYKGIQFRSRLEARWAVFFDTMGIEWEYEPQGYEIGMSFHDPENPETVYTYSDGTTVIGDWQNRIKEAEGVTVVSTKLADGTENVEWYLPDFWLPELRVWAEVKGVFGDAELLTTVRSVDGWSMGLPNIEDFYRGDRQQPTGLLYLGDIPNPERNRGTGSHVMFTQHKGVDNRIVRFRFNHDLQRVELEPGDTYNHWWYLDVTCMSENNISYYAEEESYKRIVKGLPRNSKLRNGDWPWGPPGRYLPIEIDEFGEQVLEAGWKTARNYQF